ncbi:MAG: DNA polymerase/3'-5' exonuclease PolX [Candidatus Liptonbacteria bacterium]|nr:DNA polymerase/3'-5' exonuclease PolX [Candidatus Liptonbacteria bacterium]
MTLTNLEIAKILREIGEYLEMQDIPFKPRAYEKAALAVENLGEEEAGDIYKSGGIKALEEIPGVGVSIAEKIEELLKTGRSKYYEELKKKTPVNLSELTRVEGLGPKSIKKLYRKLGVKNIKDLEKAAKAGKIRNLEGFGQKSEEKILTGIEFLKKAGGRFLLGDILPVANMLEGRLKNLAGVEKATVAGSVRRRRETIGDIDILVISKKPSLVTDYFTNMPEVARVIASGETKSSIKLSSGLNVDLRVVPSESYGAALNYFTGSKDHNVALRKLAIEKGWKLNEYGLFSATGEKSADSRGLHADQRGKNQRMIAEKNEEEIYKALGMEYVEPEMRENSGEIELALKHRLPKLVGYGDLQGDLQTQTNWTDGSDSIEDMAQAAIKTGLKYIAITDHTKGLAMTGGLDEKRILKQMAEIDRVNKKFAGKIKVLKGTECDILKDGRLDLSDGVLSKLDIVGISVHSLFNFSEADQTARVKRAISNPNADILFHPTGRLINRREAIKLDMAEIISTAKKTGTILEANAEPSRLDLKDEHIRKAIDAGVKISIDSDAHSAVNVGFMELGIAQARRGWAARKDVINAWPLETMLKFLK